MTVVYVDLLFLLNSLVDYLLLLAAARLAGEPLHRGRFLTGAVLGGGYAVAAVLPGSQVLMRPSAQMAAAALMVTVSYGGSGRLLRQGLLFLLLSCALGGGMLAIAFMGRDSLMLENGMLYEPSDIKHLLLSAAICYVTVTTVFRKIGKCSCLTGEVVISRLRLKERTLEVATLIDTGNTLTDPMTGKNVMVAEGLRINALLPDYLRLSCSDLQQPTCALERFQTEGWYGTVQLLPYRSVGVERGLLLALRVDSAEIGERKMGRMLVALSPNPISDAVGYQALIGPLNGKGGKTCMAGGAGRTDWQGG